MDLIKLGSIRLSNEAQIPGFDCDSSGDISFGDTVSGKELQWVKLKSGLLIADRCVCTNISWKELDEKGFVLGTPITIDNKTYWCRCLQVGAKEETLNEWDAALDETEEDNKLWHWKHVLFWGQETSACNTSYRAVRGWSSARYWYHYDATVRGVGVGFRPVLEALGSVTCFPDTLVGKKAKAYCPDGITIEGSLIDFSDYDIVLKTNSSVRANRSWVTKDGNNIIINRENITWLKEAEIEN